MSDTVKHEAHRCDVCGKVSTTTRWCSVCKAWICKECRHKPWARIKAALRRKLEHIKGSKK